MISATKTDDLVDDELLAWIEGVAGGNIVAIERRSAGASRAGYAVDVAHVDGGTQDLWLRIDTGHGPQSGTSYTVRREGAVYRALGLTPVRVPLLVAIHPTRDAFLAERLEGRNWFAQITDAEEQVATARAFMQQLAAIHAIDVRLLDIAELGPQRRICDHVRDELTIWDAQYREGIADDPVISLALAWLAANVPPDGDWPLVLVQGDTGPGNFLYADGDVVAVMDWEMAHWGDLHDDLGWLCVRETQERFTHLPDRFRDYEQFGGRSIDLDRLRYFRVLAQMRCAVGTRRGLLARDSRGEIANHVIYSTMHLSLLADALAEAMSIERPARVAAPRAIDDHDATWLFDVALDDLRDVIVPAIEPGFAQQRAKGLARLLKYLRTVQRIGPTVEARDRVDLSVLLGLSVVDAASGRRDLCTRLEADSIEHRSVAAYCLGYAARRTDLARDAMGALADRRYSPIE